MNRLRPFLESRSLQLWMALLLIVALAGWPYGFYTFLRIAVCLSASLFAWGALHAGHRTWATIMAGIAILFNPIVPVYLDRVQWHVIDLVAAGLFAFFPRVESS